MPLRFGAAATVAHRASLAPLRGVHRQAATRSRIFLPPYSPGLNPAERVWLYLHERLLDHRLLADENTIVVVLPRLEHPDTQPAALFDKPPISQAGQYLSETI
ncbi:MAG: transposase [Rhodopila sp.]